MPGLPRSVGLRARGLRLARPPFLPNGALTMHPSAACHAQSIPIARRTRVKQDRPRPLQRPVATHSVKRSWTVDFGPNARGSCAHWLPVRASQIRPSKIARSSRRGRPGFLRGLSTRRTGSSSRPQRVVDAPDRRVVLGAGPPAGGGNWGIHAASLPLPTTFRIASNTTLA